MTIIQVSPKKQVRISLQNTGSYFASLVQDCGNGDHQVLVAKTFSRLTSAQKWAFTF